jgi:hypothetical protein
MRATLAAALGALALLLVSACGPMYETKHIYTPPADPVSRTCVASCAQTREACIHNNEIKYESCQRDAERDYDACTERALRKKKKPEKECYKSYCEGKRRASLRAEVRAVLPRLRRHGDARAGVYRDV